MHQYLNNLESMKGKSPRAPLWKREFGGISFVAGLLICPLFLGLSLFTSCTSAASPGKTVPAAVVPTATLPHTATPVPAPTTLPDAGPGVAIGDARFAVEVVDTPAARNQGLSGRPLLKPGTGMLFVFEKEGPYGFWMKDMQFPLDLVWINGQCQVVDITPNVPMPAPGQTPGDLPIYMPRAPVLYVLEINAGEAAATGIMVGKPVRFEGALAGKYGC